MGIWDTETLDCTVERKRVGHVAIVEPEAASRDEDSPVGGVLGGIGEDWQGKSRQERSWEIEEAHHERRTVAPLVGSLHLLLRCCCREVRCCQHADGALLGIAPYHNSNLTTPCLHHHMSINYTSIVETALHNWTTARGGASKGELEVCKGVTAEAYPVMYV